MFEFDLNYVRIGRCTRGVGALLAPMPLFPLLWWLSSGGWLALLATPAVLFGMLCNEGPLSFLAWAAAALVRALAVHWLAILEHGVVIALVAAVVGAGLYALIRGEAGAAGSGAGGGWSGAPAGKDARDVPAGARGEVRRVLEAATHYEVLEVARDAERAAVKAAWRAKSLLTHPDKVGPHAEGANEAVSAVKNVRARD